MICEPCCMNFATFAMGSPTDKSDVNVRLQPAQSVGNGHSGKQIPIPFAADEDYVRHNLRYRLLLLKLQMHKDSISH